MLSKSQTTDNSILNWFLARQISESEELIEIEVIGKNEIVDKLNSNITIKINKNSKKSNDFKCMNLSDLKCELKEYSGHYRFVNTFLNNCPADYERYRFENEVNPIRIIFKARKSDHCFK